MRKELQSKLVQMAMAHSVVAFLWDGIYTELMYNPVGKVFYLRDDAHVTLFSSRSSEELLCDVPDTVELVIAREAVTL